MREKEKNLGLRYGLIGYFFNLLFLGIFLLIYALTTEEGIKFLFLSTPLPILALLLIPLVSFLFGYRGGLARQLAERRLEEAQERELELRTAEEALRHEVEQAEELRRLMEFSMQEMKHPLTSIIGYACTVQQYWEALDEGKKRDYLNFINIAASRLEGIQNNVHQLLNLRLMDLQMDITPTDIREIVGEVAELLSAFYQEKGISVVQRYSQGFPMVEGDPSRLFDIFYNVLDILFRFSSDGSSITVWGNPHNGEAVLRLRVSGQEHAADMIKRLSTWNIGSPLKDEREASIALCLYIARRLLEAHRGRLWAESTLSGGLSIYVALPRAAHQGQQVPGKGRA
jgi:signal transduction histidine kinase